MFIDYVVKIDVNAPTGIVTRNNLFQYAWVVEKDENNELDVPKLIAGNDFANYFDNQEMIDFGISLGTQEIYLVNNSNLAAAHDTCFWLVDSLAVLTSTELALFQGFKVLTASTMSQEAKTFANAKYTACIVDGNTTTSPYELLEAYLSRTVANLNDMQYMTLSTWQPVLNNESQYLEAFNSNLIFANTPDSTTPAIELANLKMGGISWTRLLVGEVVKQNLQNDIKLFITNSNLHMEHEDYILVEDRGNNLLQSYVNQNLIGEGATFVVDYNQLEDDIIQGTLKNVKVNLDGINSLWRVEGIIYS